MFVMFSALDFCADDANVVVARKASNAFRRLHLDDEDDDAECSSSAREEEEEQHARWEDFRELVVLAKKSRRFCCRCNDDDEEGDDDEEEEEEEEGANRDEAFIFMRQRASFDFYLFTLRKKSNIFFSRGVA